jgi:hypothetical protein
MAKGGNAKNGASATSKKAKTSSTPPAWDTWSTDEHKAIDEAMGKADPNVIAAAFQRISSNFARSEWLSPGHDVGTDPRSVDAMPPHDSARTLALAEYAAASVPLHVADGWTYFGRAMSALAAGGIEVAQHLLYYSELRAMHALLFRHGVVLLNKKNIALRTTGTVLIPFPASASHVAGNSHQAIWVLFRHWIKTKQATEFCARTLQLRGQPLSKWVDERPMPSSLRSVLGALMERWGMDVARFSSDRELRNQLSYNPTRMLMSPTGVSPEFVADVYQQVWMMLEPETSNAFENLDRYIMRDAFQAFSAQDPDGQSVRVPAEYVSMNEYWVDRVLGSGAGRSVAAFFDRPEEQPPPAVLSNAGQDLSGNNLGVQLTGMIGRAVILLRLATGSAKDLLKESGISSAQVEFWLDDMLSLHGIRLPEGAPRSYLDLYEGISDTVEDLGLLHDEADPADMSLITEQLAREFQTLSGFERVPAWAVA